MTVFLVHPVRDDVRDALRFGQLDIINAGYVYGDQIDDGKLPGPVMQNIRAAARRFDADDDYLLIAGDHVQLVAMSAELAAYRGTFQVLRWERQANAYMPVRITT